MDSINGGSVPPEKPPDWGDPSTWTNTQLESVMEVDAIMKESPKVRLDQKNVSQDPVSNVNVPFTKLPSKESPNIEKIRQCFKYQPTDIGPFHVYIENIKTNFEGKLNPIKVGEIILRAHSEIDNKIKQIQSIGRNRIRIILKDYLSANVLLSSTNLKKHDLGAFIPKFLLFRLGVVKQIDVDLSEEYLKSRISPYDLHCKFEVDFVRRINRKIKKDDDSTELQPTRTILVSFKSQTLPKYILINKVLYDVELYQQKVLLCYNCYRYGHMGRQCRNKVRCIKCGENHNSESCQNNDNKVCLVCQGDHRTTDLDLCPEFKRQKNIKSYMSNTNCSYKDASKEIPQHTYASIVSSSSSSQLNKSLSQPSFVNVNSVASTAPSPVNIVSNLISHSTFPHTSKFRSFSQPIHSPKTNKRPRIINSNPISSAHKEIISNTNIPKSQGGILSSPKYKSTLSSSNIEEKLTSDNMFQIILQVVLSTIEIIKSTNFEIQESTILNVIKQNLSSSIGKTLEFDG
ncbi:unnamed protein product [Psylliodes chrysocephalus]|uniref:CCHC-type domain-containing protein n=1 Tax=Psylliodes chrysocephalus TaxID=3402493 RepID=A0A9P0CWY9_9CUCU|nr:unnamed protein product [Psylliodes chrysocephala]